MGLVESALIGDVESLPLVGSLARAILRRKALEDPVAPFSEMPVQGYVLVDFREVAGQDEFESQQRALAQGEALARQRSAGI